MVCARTALFELSAKSVHLEPKDSVDGVAAVFPIAHYSKQAVLDAFPVPVPESAHTHFFPDSFCVAVLRACVLP